jgi:hypothetical protein
MSERRSAPWWMLLAGFGMLVAGGLAAWYLYLTHGGAATGPPVASPVAVTQPAATQPTTIYITVPAAPRGATGSQPAAGVAGTRDASGGSSTRSAGDSTSTEDTMTVTVDESTHGSGNTVVAHNGAIVFVGDNGELKANTGPTSASGTVAIDADSSTISTGASTSTAASTPPASGTGTTTPAGTDPPAGADTSAKAALFGTKDDDPVASGGSRTGSYDAAVSSGPNGPAVRDVFTEGLADRPVAISGFENHSVNVAGNDQIAVYDDSNLFVNRDGPINANTGDTDSSGLNAVDVTGSRVRSGDSDVRGESADEDAPPQGTTTDSATTNGTPANGGTATGGTPANGTATGGTRADSTATVVDPDQTASASDTNPLVIGADGYDDLAVRSSGNRNTVVYDDSNVVLGGSGKVNAEIGDSDTGGAVVMGIHNSDVEAGKNF